MQKGFYEATGIPFDRQDDMDVDYIKKILEYESLENQAKKKYSNGNT